MACEYVHSANDPRLAPYRDLIQGNRSRHDSPWFIAEGRLVVERLLSSRYPVHSVLATEPHVQRLAQLVPEEVPLLVASDDVLRRIVGFDFHRGVLACGQRIAEGALAKAIDWTQPRLTVVVCPHVATAENLGALLRSSRAFGVDAVLLGRGVDPLARRVLRVSMAAGLFLPVLSSDELLLDLCWLRDEAGCELVGTVLDEEAEPLPGVTRSPRTALVIGNEAEGLEPQVEQLCQRRVTIPMHGGTDSLNLAVAAGVFLYHFTRDARNTPETLESHQ